MIMRERGRPLQDGKRGAEIAELAEAIPGEPSDFFLTNTRNNFKRSDLVIKE